MQSGTLLIGASPAEQKAGAYFTEVPEPGPQLTQQWLADLQYFAETRLGKHLGIFFGVYIAGPMRGYPDNNFYAFDAVRDAVSCLPDAPPLIISPADLDREHGDLPSDPDVLRDTIIQRDVEAMLKCDAVLLMPGWEHSEGARAEAAVAAWADMAILSLADGRALLKEEVYSRMHSVDVEFQGLTPVQHPPLPDEEPEDILHEAYRLTTGARNNSYGPPDQDFTRTAKMWSALKGVDFSAADVAMFMICLKLSRETHMGKRDSATDIAGYARCLWLCRKEEAKRGGLPYDDA